MTFGQYAADDIMLMYVMRFILLYIYKNIIRMLANHKRVVAAELGISRTMHNAVPF